MAAFCFSAKPRKGSLGSQKGRDERHFPSARCKQSFSLVKPKYEQGATFRQPMENTSIVRRGNLANIAGNASKKEKAVRAAGGWPLRV